MRPTPQSFLRHPLSWMLASPANVRILKELSRHGGELASSYLVERTRMSRPSVLAALDQLVGMGLVEGLGSAKSRLFRVRQGHPLTPALNALFEVEDQRSHQILAAIRDAAKAAGVRAAWLYGSVARGEDRPGSDIDVAIVSPPFRLADAKSAVRDALRSVEEALGFDASVVGVSTEDVLRLADEADPWWAEVVRDGVPVVGPDPTSLLAKLRAKERVAS